MLQKSLFIRRNVLCIASHFSFISNYVLAFIHSQWGRPEKLKRERNNINQWKRYCPPPPRLHSCHLLRKPLRHFNNASNSSFIAGQNGGFTPSSGRQRKMPVAGLFYHWAMAISVGIKSMQARKATSKTIPNSASVLKGSLFSMRIWTWTDWLEVMSLNGTTPYR